MSERAAPIFLKFLRPDKPFPTVWCEGCGIGIILGAIVRAVEGLGVDPSDVAMVSGIGCSGRMPVYADFATMHVTHGRALAVATGLKLARPHMKMIVVMGDGDAVAIGGNHFIHAARRNLEMCAIVVNNMTYGMTGGQFSPTTPVGDPSYTSAYGTIEPTFDIPALAEAAGASFVARTTVYHVMEMQKIIARALAKKGFSAVEVVSNCHTYYGKMTGMKTAVDMMHWMKDATAPVTLAPERREGKMPRGVLVDRELPEYGEAYVSLLERARADKARLLAAGMPVP